MNELFRSASSRLNFVFVRRAGEIIYSALIFSVLLLLCPGCGTGGSGKQEPALKLLLNPAGEGGGVVTVSRHGVAQTWLGDTLAIISWWDPQGAGHTEPVSAAAGWVIEPVPTEEGYRAECSRKESALSFQMIFTVEGDILTVNVPAAGMEEKGEARIRSLRVLPRFGAAKKGDEGYLTLANEVGALCYYDEKPEKEYRVQVYTGGINMPLFGLIRNSGGFGCIVTSGQFDCQFCITTHWGKENLYSVDPVFLLRAAREESRLYENLTAEYHFLPAGEADWYGVGKRYRQYNFAHRGIRPLKQRMAGSPYLAAASQAMEVRLRLGVKPVPYEILEQTPANEPPMRIFLTFEKVRNIFDEFHRQGIAHTEFCLVGWNIGGHDGRYPQMFPVETTLGGEDQLRKTIAHGQSLGFQVVCHDNYIDAYRIAENWDETLLAKKPDGQVIKGGTWGGGQAYTTCMIPMYNLAKENLPRIRDLGFRGIHYTDVLSITAPAPCYDPHHLATRSESAAARNRIMELADRLIGGVQSEGAFDFAAPVMDRFLYTSIHKKNSTHLDLPYLDADVPLYASVYHGIITYNLDNKTVNSLPGETDYLKNIEYGGIPTQYFYGHFYIEGKGRTHWIGNRDYQFSTPGELTKIVSGIKTVFDDFEKIKHLQMEFVDGHHSLAENVYETVYSNGQRIVVNYRDLPYSLSSGEEIPARGFSLLPVKKGK